MLQLSDSGRDPHWAAARRLTRESERYRIVRHPRCNLPIPGRDRHWAAARRLTGESVSRDALDAGFHRVQVTRHGIDRRIVAYGGGGDVERREAGSTEGAFGNLGRRDRHDAFDRALGVEAGDAGPAPMAHPKV